MAKTKELYGKVISLDPDGKSGSAYNDYLKASITYTEAAEEALGRIAFLGVENDPAPLRAFIAKYPESKFLKDEYALLSRFYYLRESVPMDVAAQFFSEYTAKFPHNAGALNDYVKRIIADKAPLDKGIELAEKICEIAGSPPNPNYVQNLAELYILKGDPARAEEVYGKDFLDQTTSSFGYWLTGYANFWIKQNKNLDRAEAIADLVGGLNPGQGPLADPQGAADIFLKIKKEDKALAVYGPASVEKNASKPDFLASYAYFWNLCDKNLDSALVAVRKALEIAPKYTDYATLGQILFKMKNYPEALRAAEKAVELVKPIAAKYPGFPTQQYEGLVKQIKDAQAREKAPAVKK